MRRMSMILCGLPIRNIFIVRQENCAIVLVVHLLYKPTNEPAEDWEKYARYGTKELFPLLKKHSGAIRTNNFRLCMGVMVAWNIRCQP